MQTDLDLARRALLRRILGGLATANDKPLSVSPEVAVGLRALPGPANMEGTGWVEVKPSNSNDKVTS